MGKRAEVHIPKWASQKSGYTIFIIPFSIPMCLVLVLGNNMQVYTLSCVYSFVAGMIICAFNSKYSVHTKVQTDCIAVITQKGDLKCIWTLHVRMTLHYNKNVKPICKLLSGKNTSAVKKSHLCVFNLMLNIHKRVFFSQRFFGSPKPFKRTLFFLSAKNPFKNPENLLFSL